MKYYLVMERDYSYNDEYHVAKGGGSPVRVFKQKTVAESLCRELEFKWLNDQENYKLSDYIEQTKELLNTLINEKFLTTEQAKELDCWRGKTVDFSSLSAEKKDRLLEICADYDLWGYEVLEIDGE